MTMAIFRDDITQSFDLFDSPAYSPKDEVSRSRRANGPIVESKMRIPDLANFVQRPRLRELLRRNTQNSAGTMVVGRSGSGKTYLAAEYASTMDDVLWYSLDAGDTDQTSFNRCFLFGLFQDAANNEPPGFAEHQKGPNPMSTMELFADITAGLELRESDWPSVIVLDGIHHLFDCDWFSEFFNLLIASLPYSSHVIMLSRSKPPNPIWRLRSKQILNVIDERTMAFTLSEAQELFVQNELDRNDAKKAFSESFGRVGKIFRILERHKKAETSR